MTSCIILISKRSSNIKEELKKSDDEEEQKATKPPVIENMCKKDVTTLSNNGIPCLYSMKTTNVKLQVVYISFYKGFWLARLSDGVNLSPIVVIKNDAVAAQELRVGHVIKVKKAHFKNGRDLPFNVLDCIVPYVEIEAFSIELVSDELIGQYKDAHHDYKVCLHNVSHLLMKHLPSFKVPYQREILRLKLNESYASELRMRGNALYRQTSYEEASLCYLGALRQNPLDYRIHCNRAIVHACLNQHEDAQMLARFSLLLNPFHEKAYKRVCNSFVELKEVEKVKTWQRNCVVVCPTFVEIENININKGQKVSESTRGNIDEDETEDDALDEEDNCDDLDTSMSETEEEEETPLIINISKKLYKINPSTTTPTTENKNNVNKNNHVAVKNNKQSSKDKPVKNATGEKASTTTNTPTVTPPVTALTKEVKVAKVPEKKEDEGELLPGFNSTGKDVVYVTLLSNGRKFYKEANFCEANGFYETILNANMSSGRREEHLTIFMLLLCQVETGDCDNCVVAIPELVKLLEKMVSLQSEQHNTAALLPTAPIHYLLSKAYYHTWQQQEMQQHISQCEVVLKKEKNKLPLLMPGFKDSITQTEYSYLQNWCSKGSWKEDNSLKVISKCRYSECTYFENTGNFRNIVKNSDYNGHINIGCELDCSMCYHLPCWKLVKDALFKEDSSLPNKNKLGDKDLLQYCCLTPDCSGNITSILIYDEDARVKQTFESESNGPNSKSRKNKQKKKKKNSQSASQTVPKPKENANTGKKASNSIVEEVKGDNAANVVPPNNSKKEQKPVVDLPIDEIDYDKVTVLVKPEIPESTEVKKAPKKKNKKSKPLDIRSDIVDTVFHKLEDEHSEYVQKIKKLKALREEAEEAKVAPSASKPVIPYGDLRKPYYRTSQLMNKHTDFEKLFCNRTLPALDIPISRTIEFDMNEETVNNLLSFMQDFLQSEGPMYITDERLHEYMRENFTKDCMEYVNHIGGIDKFLIRSIDFALIDDVVCVRSQVLEAQALVASAIRNVFDSKGKYYLSDKLKAKAVEKLTDTRELSRCSSQSSIQSSSTKNHHSTPTRTATRPSSTSSMRKTGISEIDTFDEPLSPVSSKYDLNLQRNASECESTDIDATMQHLYNSSSNNVFDDEFDESGLLTALQSYKDQLADRDKKYDALFKKHDNVLKVKSDLEEKVKTLRQKASSESVMHKKRMADVEETIKLLEQQIQQQKTQHDSELKRSQTENHKLKEEVKSLTAKLNALELHTDQSGVREAELNNQVSQLTKSLSRYDEELAILRNSLSVSAARAKNAEQKYIELNSKTCVDIINKSMQACDVDLTRLSDLQRHANVQTIPSLRSIEQVQTILRSHKTKLTSSRNDINKKCEQWLTVLSQGRPLFAKSKPNLPTIPNEVFCSAVTSLLCLFNGSKVCVSPAIEGFPSSSGGSARPPPAQQQQGSPARFMDGASSELLPRSPEPSTVRNMKQSVNTDHLQVFVADIPIIASRNTIMEIFEQFGKVLAVRFTESDSPNTKHGFILFANREGKVNALNRTAREPVEIFGHTVAVMPVNSDAPPVQERRRPEPEVRGAAAAVPVPQQSLEPKFRQGPQSRQYSQLDDFTEDIHHSLAHQVTRPTNFGSSASATVLQRQDVQKPTLSSVLFSCENRYSHNYSVAEIKEAILELKSSNSNWNDSEVIVQLVGDMLQKKRSRPAQQAASTTAPWAHLAAPPVLPFQAPPLSGDEECAICIDDPMDDKTKLTTLDCNHTFHTKCINKWLLQKSDCPICRKHAVNKKEFPSLSSLK